MRTIIALCGAAGSGKDTFAKECVRNGYSVLKFAAPLKRAVRGLFPSMDTHAHMEGALKDVVDPCTGVTPRALLQFIGTELLQHGVASRFPTIGRTIFCPSVCRDLEDTPLAVITDMRFVHEYTCLQNALKRGDVLCVIRLQRTRPTMVADHASETEYLNIPFDFIITNDGTPEDLYAKAVEVCTHLGTASRLRIER